MGSYWKPMGWYGFVQKVCPDTKVNLQRWVHVGPHIENAKNMPYLQYRSIYLSIYRSIDLSIYRSIDLSIYRSIDLSIYLSIYRSIYLSIYRSIYLSIYRSIYLSIDLSIYLSIDLSIYLSIDLSIYLSIYLPSGILTRTLKIEKMHARTMLVVFLTFSSFGSVHVSVTHVTSPLTWTLKQVFLNSIQLTWTP